MDHDSTEPAPPTASQGDSPAEPEPTSSLSEGSEESFLRRVARGSDASTLAGGLWGAEDMAWAGPRFDLRRRLGAGGFGVVYEAFDRKRNAVVALKRSGRRDPDALHRFKLEFRSLADLEHRNLVRLFELHGDEAAWFFTMELVRGQDARSHIRAAPGGFDEARLRAVLGQLVEGLRFLHGAGRVHADIKPSNVMVDGDGRVVLLDFGLSFDLTRVAEAGEHPGMGGTPLYMAPEQHGEGRIGAATDWYAMGVMLFETLVGRPPFTGSLASVMHRKLTEEAPAPADLVEGVPADLNRLCVDLLCRRPEDRPSSDEVWKRLDRGRSAIGGPSSPPRTTAEALAELEGAPTIRASAQRSGSGTPFVGRERELGQLRGALALPRPGHAAVVLVHAGSGMGKTALLQGFLDGLREIDEKTLVLQGRCFEQESMPDKTLDGLLDALGRALSGMSESEVTAVTPRDVGDLLRVFPALRRVRALRASQRPAESGDKVEVRRRATTALRDLLTLLGERRRLVLFMDDLQWGDAQGGALLAELLRPPTSPPVLFVGTYRADEEDRSECLRALLPSLRALAESGAAFQEIALPRLTSEEARSLAESALGASASALSESVARVAAESDGSPLFLLELCRFSMSGPGDGQAPARAPVSLSEMLTARLSALPEEARRFLEVIAVAGQPIDRGVAASASDLGDEEPLVVRVLRGRSLVRTRTGGRDQEIETYHDRIRETVLDLLGPGARARHHLRLAGALVAVGDTDQELLASHFQGAGDVATASGYWERAGDEALETLGFERAARLYQQAISCLADAQERRRTLHGKLGNALGHGGRGLEAAVAYLTAADGAEASQGVAMQRLAAERYLLSGHLEEGFAVLRTVLVATGLSIPKTPIEALGRGLASMAALRIRGFSFRARPLDQIPADVLTRIDILSAATQGVTHADPPRALYYHTRALSLAFESGDSYRLLRELAMNLCFRASLRGEEGETRFESEIQREIDGLLESLRGSGPRFQAAQGLVELARGVASAFRLKYRAGRAHLERAEAHLTACPIRLANDVMVARVWLVSSLFGLGEWNELSLRHAAFLTDARDRGDRFAEVHLSVFRCFLELAADRVEGAERVTEELRRLQPSGYPQIGTVNFQPVLMTALYRDRGEGDSVLNEAPGWWERAKLGIGARMNPSVRGYLLFHQGAGYLAAAAIAGSARRSGHLREAEGFARALARMNTPFARAAGLSLRAGAAAGRGEREAATALVAEAEARFTLLEMAHYAAAARCRRGQLLGGEEGRRLVASAHDQLSCQGVKNPPRMVGALLAGRW